MQETAAAQALCVLESRRRVTGKVIVNKTLHFLTATKGPIDMIEEKTKVPNAPLQPIRTYEVTVSGFPPVKYSARSRGKATARAWRDYTSAYDTSFKNFLAISRVALVPDPPGIGRRVLVGDEPATVVIGYGQYVHFMRDDGDTVLCSHPNDVAEIPKVNPPSRSLGVPVRA